MRCRDCSVLLRNSGKMSRSLCFRLKITVATRKYVCFRETSRIFSATPFRSSLPGCDSLRCLVNGMWAWLRAFVVKVNAGG